MPYKNASDPKLPDYVKSMSDAKRRRWVGAFNTSFKQHADEGTAFRVANGVTKTKGVAEEMTAKVQDALAGIEFAADALSNGDEENDDNPYTPFQTPDRKDYDDGAVMVYEEPKPYGGAKSFAELAEVMKAQKTQYAVGDLAYAFRCITENIMSAKDEEMSAEDKGTAVLNASQELAALLGAPLTALPKVGLAETKTDKRPILQRLVDFITGGKEEEGGYGDAFWSFVDSNGEWRWLSAYSNNFKDRDGEIFTEAAHKEFVQVAEKLNRYPELWLWHTPGSRVGFADFLDLSDGFVVASGLYDPEYQYLGPQFANEVDSTGVSHGYRYPADEKDSDGTIHRYYDFEISPLPRERASNPHMPLDTVLKEATKMFGAKRQYLVGKLGEKKVAALETGLEVHAKELEAAGIDWKEVTEALAETTASVSPTPAVPATPAAEPAAAVVAVATAPAVATPAVPATEATTAMPATPAAEAPKTEDDDELKKRVAAIEETQTVLVDATKEIVASIKELRRDKDEIIGNAMSPRRPAPLDPEQRPSQSDSTLMSEDKAAKLREELKIEGDEKESTNPAYKYVRPLVSVGQ